MRNIESDFIQVLRLLKVKKGVEYTWIAEKLGISYTDLMSLFIGDKHYSDLELLLMHKKLIDYLKDTEYLVNKLIKLEKRNLKEEGSALDVDEDLNINLQLIFIYLIQEKGISQAHLARQSGLARQNFNRWLQSNFVQNRTLYKLLRSIEHKDSEVENLKSLSKIKLYIEI